jgi:tetratricopeptide (TPR) repeat protein
MAPAPKKAVTMPAAPALDPAAAEALREATLYATSGDSELQLAALENVALAYPDSQEAGRALLAAGDLHRDLGEAAEADTNYQEVLNLSSSRRLTRALAHKALGDMRRETVGDDGLVAYHYAQAEQALSEEAREAPSGGRAQALVHLGEIRDATGKSAAAATAFAEAANLTSSARASDEVTARLAEVL